MIRALTIGLALVALICSADSALAAEDAAAYLANRGIKVVPGGYVEFSLTKKPTLVKPGEENSSITRFFVVPTSAVMCEASYLTKDGKVALSTLTIRVGQETVMSDQKYADEPEFRDVVRLLAQAR